tara:strand:+ start:3467 stop:4858 length:1392 start_codon:yes stop_codon:yes gene_type:complete
MSKKINKFFKKIANENKIEEGSDFGDFFYKKSEELSAINVDDAFKLNLIKNEDLNSKPINKISFFNYFSNKGGAETEYSLKKWKNLYYKIRPLAKNKYHAQILAKEYSNDFDNREEAENFMHWFRFYSNGEHKKYSGEKMKIKKRAAYPLGLNDGPYPQAPSFNESDDIHSNDQVTRAKENIKGQTAEEFLDKINLSYDQDLEPESVGFSEEELALRNKFFKSINRAVKGVLGNMMNAPGLSQDQVDSFMNHIRGLAVDANNLRSSAAVSSVIYKAANKLKKDGISYGVDELNKIAQEVESTPNVQQQPAETDTPQPVGEAPTQDPGDSENQNDSGIPRNDEVEPAKFEDIKTDGPQDGEYEKIIDEDITITDAADKLDQVASMLADRRVIRNLAEFDIMLDKLGIASMFPELAESQSKLIDAFGYALTRVTKMMGQLSNAQTLMVKTDVIPGSSQASEDSEA